MKLVTSFDLQEILLTLDHVEEVYADFEFS
jgi:hypothetical protein